MRRLNRAFLSLALTALLVAPAAADEFTGGHIFVGTSADAEGTGGRVVEFAPDGTHVRTHTVAFATRQTASGLVFGPDGALYVVPLFGNDVVRLDASGQSTQFATLPEGGITLNFSADAGPRGRVHVATAASVVVVSADGSTAGPIQVVMEAYAAWPTRLYLVGLDGRIAYAGGLGPFGFHPKELGKAIEDYFAAIV